MPCSRPCCSNGREDTSRTLSLVTLCTSGHVFVHSLLKELTIVTSHGQSKRCRHFFTFPYSCSLPAWWYSSGTLISRYSSWCYRGSGFARLCTDASRSCRSFVTTALISPHSHCQYGTSLLEYHFSHLRLFVGSRTWIYFSWGTYHRFRRLSMRHGKRLLQGMRKTVEEAALNSTSKIYTHEIGRAHV